MAFKTKIVQLGTLFTLLLGSVLFASSFLSGVPAYAACPEGQVEQYSSGGQTQCVTPESASTDTGTDEFKISGLCAEGEKIQYSQDGSVTCVTDTGAHECGAGEKVVKVSFNFGCRGSSYCSGRTGSTCNLNPITDIMFAIFRFLSAGVGLIVIGSIIVAGIQYSASRGNPQATEASIKRITNAIIGLLIYIFMFAILNFLVPGGMFL